MMTKEELEESAKGAVPQARMTTEELAEIKARAASATPGPWYHIRPRDEFGFIKGPGPEVMRYQDNGAPLVNGMDRIHVANWPHIQHRSLLSTKAWDQGCLAIIRDFDFIAQARTDIPRLIQAVEELQYENDNLKNQWLGFANEDDYKNTIAELQKQLAEAREKLERCNKFAQTWKDEVTSTKNDIKIYKRQIKILEEIIMDNREKLDNSRKIALDRASAIYQLEQDLKVAKEEIERLIKCGG